MSRGGREAGSEGKDQKGRILFGRVGSGEKEDTRLK